jgi:ACS family hexuronate transporter-like MFS transporter
VAKDLWTAVAFVSIATSCHQAWSANMFTVASDAFPSRAVGSVVGFGGMCGGIGGMLMLLVAGGMLQWLGNFTPLFIFAGVMHPLAWIAIRALVGIGGDHPPRFEGSSVDRASRVVTTWAKSATF